LEASSELKVCDIVIPCVDQSSIQDLNVRSRFKNEIEKIIPLAEKYGVNLSLETDLNPKDFKDLLDQLDSPRIKVNYDIGNSASMGYDLEDELQAYGYRISDIHIKDRKLGAGSVELGMGNANFGKFFQIIQEYDYEGPFIMQAFRDEEGLEIFKKQLSWINNNYLQKG